MIFSVDTMPTYKSYHSYLIESLKDPAEAAAYLDAVLEDGDMEHILLALKNVAEARGDNDTSASLQLQGAGGNHKQWEECYRSLSQGQYPDLGAIAHLLKDLGLKLTVTVQDEQLA